MAKLPPITLPIRPDYRPTLEFLDMIVRHGQELRDAVARWCNADSQPGDTGVRIEWEMTEDQWEQLRGVLLQHTDVEYIGRLADAGKLGRRGLYPVPGQLVHYKAVQAAGCVETRIATVAAHDQSTEAREYVSVRLCAGGMLGPIRHGTPSVNLASWH